MTVEEEILITTNARKSTLFYRIVKRTFDIVASLAASLILLIPMLIIAALIEIKDPGSPLFVQKRVGLNGKTISIYKFRSMYIGADNLEKSLTPEQRDEYAREFKLKDDPRLLGYKKAGDGEQCFGAKMRRASIDELPQIFFNVLLKGDMSLVGPRPILQRELEMYYTPEEQKAFTSVKPGITGLWQVMGRNDCTYESGDRQRVELRYIKEKGIWTDVKILFKTIGTILQRGGGVLNYPSEKTQSNKCHISRLKYIALLPMTMVVGAVGIQQETALGEIASENKNVAEVIPVRSALYLLFKRVFDLVCSLAALILLSPVFLAAAVLIKLQDGGPVIHRRVCVGKNGQYNMLKFRTMVTDADDLEKYLTNEQMIEYRSKIKLDDDPRLTKVGRVLRKLSIDELPQLVNVLRNEMSIIGPRPVTEDEILFYPPSELPEFLDTKPGITGYWQTSGRSDCTYESGERQKLEMYYVRNRSLRMDIKILFKTVGVVLSRKGAK